MVEVKILKEVTSTINILYAEDEEILRRGMLKSLERLFKNVYVAKDGYEGIELFKNHDIDLVMTDINMPNIDGVDMLKSIKELTDNPPPLIVLTAHNESELLIRLIDLEIDKFLLKPVDKQKMIDALYKSCLMINNKDMLEKYHQDIEQAYDEINKKTRILENKLKHIAQEKNLQQLQEKPKSKLQENNIKKAKENYFDMLNQEDSDELEDLCVEMDTYVTRMFLKDAIDEDYLIKFSLALEKYSSILNLYPIFNELAVVLRMLAVDIRNNIDTIQNKQKDLAEYFESLHMTLENFRVKIWGTDVDDPTFFNSSFMSDINLIIMAISDAENIENDMIEFF